MVLLIEHRGLNKGREYMSRDNVIENAKKAIKMKIAICAAYIIGPWLLVMILFALFIPTDGSTQTLAVQKEVSFEEAFKEAIEIYTKTEADPNEILAAYVLGCNDMEKYDSEFMSRLKEVAKEGGPLNSLVTSDNDYSILSENYKNSYGGIVGMFRDKEADTKNFYYNWCFPIANEIKSLEPSKSPQMEKLSVESPQLEGPKAEEPTPQVSIHISCSYSDDFLDPRSFGDITFHDGNDILCEEGTPIIAVESGTIENMGWNSAGGWRIGIRSDDGKRYWYYAHMRKVHPYDKSYRKGNRVEAGKLIGYVGSTGYSDALAVNTMPDTRTLTDPGAVDKNFVEHLHIGLQVKLPNGSEELDQWVNPYPILKYLEANKIDVKDDRKDDKDDYTAIKKDKDDRVFAKLHY